MRTISANALAKLAQKDGAEPLNVVGIQWVDGGPISYYADRDLPDAPGRIMSMATIDDVTQTSGAGLSQAVEITLSDTDGTLKAIRDTQDIHLRPCWIYQYFDGLAFSDKFLLFQGLINTPIIWKEADRTIAFTVISQIEDVEIGFSIEEGQIPMPNQTLIGKAWPLCFGTVINAPALQLISPMQGTLATGVGIADWTLAEKLAAAQKLLCPYQFFGWRYFYTYTGTLSFEALIGEEPSCAAQRCKDEQKLIAEMNAQKAYEFTTFQVFGGENFPQGVPLTLNINGALFEGSFAGQTFTVTKRTHPDLVTPPSKVTNGVDVVPDYSPCGIPANAYNIDNSNSNPDNVDTGGPTTQQIQAAQDAYNNVPTSQFFWANSGAAVVLAGNEPITYVANILPSTILRVAANRQTDSGELLVTVPPEIYTVEQVDYGGYQVMHITLSRPLSSLGVGWSDDLYVTLTSSVGPNTVDVIQWLIQTYSLHGIDSTSFAHVRGLIDNYPSHFMMPGRESLTQALDEIAYQARCAVWLKDDTFYIKYLPESPTPVDTIGVSDILSGTLELTHTPTENLVTKYVATWQQDYAVPDKNTIVYRANGKKYGTHKYHNTKANVYKQRNARHAFTITSDSRDFYIYNIVDLVRKSATFWLIRESNTWNLVNFNTPLSKLNLEVFDCVTINHPAVSDTPVNGIVQSASYDSATNSIAFQCWLPLRSGERTPYDFAWPADVSESLVYPTPSDVVKGFAGGSNGPNFNVIPPPNTVLIDNTILGAIQGVDFINCRGRVMSRPRSTDIFDQCVEDEGLSKPSDRGDTKPTPKATTDNSDVQSGYTPLPSSSNTDPNNCCAEAKQLAQEALTEARKASADAGAGGGGGGNAGDANPSLDRLPNRSQKKKDGNCLYMVRVTHATATRVELANGSQSTVPGVTGVPIESTGLTQEEFGFNSLAEAQQYAAAVRPQTKDGNDNIQVAVGADFKLSATVDLGDSVTSGCTQQTSAKQGEIVSYDPPV